MTNYWGASEFHRDPWMTLTLELGERAMLDLAWESHDWGNKAAFLVLLWTP